MPQPELDGNGKWDAHREGPRARATLKMEIAFFFVLFWEGAQDKQRQVHDATVLVGVFYLCTVGIPINLRANIL